MWLKLCSFLLIAGLIEAYINNDNQYSARPSNSKSSYLNYELNRFRNRMSSTTEKTRYTPWNRSYQNHKSVSNEHKIRHTNNRFPKMDRLLNRMSKSSDLTAESTHLKYSEVKIDNNKKAVQKWVTENPHKRHFNPVTMATTTTTETNEELEAYFGEDESDPVQTKSSSNHEDNTADEDDDELNEDDDDDNNDEDESEDDETEDESDDWQAEEPTEEPTERTLTEYKWKHYGTRSRVEESRKNHQTMSNSMRRGVAEAVEHARRVNLWGACRDPRPRLIRVHSVYPDAGKAYIPHCTLLHRCADDTGCCRSNTLTCAPKHQATVHLHFYTGRPGAYNVEQLAFYNHTECHCVERTTELMARDAADETIEDRYPVRPSNGNDAVTLIKFATAPEPIRKCQCPELFTAQIVHGHCRCDCMEGNRDCVRIRRGKEYFSLKDRLCIQRGECGYPACEFGVYIRFSGRCPRKQEKIEAFSRVQPQ